MEGKFWIFIAAISLIAGVFTAVQHTQGVDRLNADLQETRSKITQMHGSLEHQKTEWSKVEALYKALQDTQSKVAPLQQQKVELEKKYRTLEGEFKYLVKSTRTAVDKTRANGPGDAFPELKLADGRTLKDAKIRKVDPNELSFIHSEGFATVSQDLLPAELRSKYDMGPGSLADALEKADKELFSPAPVANGKAKPVAAMKQAAAPSSGGAFDASGSKVDDEKAKQIRLKIVDIESKITTVRIAIANCDQQIESNNANAASAKSRGTPSTKFVTAAQAASQQAQVYIAQLVALVAEKKKLEVELASVTGK